MITRAQYERAVELLRASGLGAVEERDCPVRADPRDVPFRGLAMEYPCTPAAAEACIGQWMHLANEVGGDLSTFRHNEQVYLKLFVVAPLSAFLSADEQAEAAGVR